MILFSYLDLSKVMNYNYVCFLFIAFSTQISSIHNVSGLISTNTGIAPLITNAFAVETKV